MNNFIISYRSNYNLHPRFDFTPNFQKFRFRPLTLHSVLKQTLSSMVDIKMDVKS